MFIQISDKEVFKLLTVDRWSSFYAIYAPLESQKTISVCEINHQIELLADAVEIDGIDEAFGFTAQSRTGISLTEGTNSWPFRDLIDELKESSDESLLTPPRLLKLFVTPQMPGACRNREICLANISAITISSAKKNNCSVMAIAAHQTIPCTLSVAFGALDSAKIVRDLVHVASVDMCGKVTLVALDESGG